ncbi:hypothetical protein EWM64_g9772 [Hericium alpestre]|uniref:GATA-type domain-containing protein n=1 Tax=Hericium alpestre TaxID=135208 RepID=A0A4Y9ZJ83_9AGAM|nr:hypothetical protein EWM64_g9772 [Hericium alpestre]
MFPQSLTLPHPPSPPPNPSSIAHDNLNLPPLQFAMPHRIDSATTRLREDEAHSSLAAHPSPPPIATLSQSPSLSTSSLDRSSVSSPAPTGRTSVSSMLPHSSYASQVHYSAVEPDRTGRLYYHHAPPPHSLHPHEPTYKVHAVDPTYATNGSGHRTPHPYPPPSHVVPSQISAPQHQGHEHGAYPYPGQPHNYGVMYTDDASMKLSDRVRRRCFNCCTTDTSTWRRSSLNPGKVVSISPSPHHHPVPPINGSR